MMVYIAILRGINVGGRNKILMAELRDLLSQNGFENVTTYIQSGNILFRTPKKDAIKIEHQIHSIIKDHYGYEIPVIVRNEKEWESAINENPFLEKYDHAGLHVSLLKNVPSSDQLEKLATYDYKPDLFEIVGKNAYIYCENGYGKTKLTNKFFESKLKVTTSTRNWKTMNKLLTLIKDYN